MSSKGPSRSKSEVARQIARDPRVQLGAGAAAATAASTAASLATFTPSTALAIALTPVVAATQVAAVAAGAYGLYRGVRAVHRDGVRATATNVRKGLSSAARSVGDFLGVTGRGKKRGAAELNAALAAEAVLAADLAPMQVDGAAAAAVAVLEQPAAPTLISSAAAPAPAPASNDVAEVHTDKAVRREEEAASVVAAPAAEEVAAPVVATPAAEEAAAPASPRPSI